MHSTACAFCAGHRLACIEREGDRALVHCLDCRARVWLPAILVDYRRERGKLLQVLGGFRFKLRREGGPNSAQRSATRRYRLQLVDLRARLDEVRRFPMGVH